MTYVIRVRMFAVFFPGIMRNEFNISLINRRAKMNTI